MLKDEIDFEEIPKEIEFYFGEPNQNFLKFVQALI